jgi:hypothetical protein
VVRKVVNGGSVNHSGSGLAVVGATRYSKQMKKNEEELMVKKIDRSINHHQFT